MRDRFTTSHQVAAILDELVIVKNLQITQRKLDSLVFEFISYLGHLKDRLTDLLLGRSNCLLYATVRCDASMDEHSR